MTQGGEEIEIWFQLGEHYGYYENYCIPDITEIVFGSGRKKVPAVVFLTSTYYVLDLEAFDDPLRLDARWEIHLLPTSRCRICTKVPKLIVAHDGGKAATKRAGYVLPMGNVKEDLLIRIEKLDASICDKCRMQRLQICYFPGDKRCAVTECIQLKIVDE